MSRKIEQVTIPQVAVIWDFIRFDNYGNTVVDDAREIDCEWPQNFSESQSNQDSKESSSDEIVVNEELAIGSILWFGAYIDLPSGTASPGLLYKIVSRRKSPDIKGRNFRHTISVARFGNDLPTVE